MSIIEQAKSFAIERHGEQKRKYTGEPYWHHLRNVADTVAGVGASDETIAAAWLHDVLEDSDTGADELPGGSFVRDWVVALTDTKDPRIGNRAARKLHDRKRLAQADNAVHTIKLADLIDNTASIVEHDPKFARVYLDEKKELLLVLTRGHKELIERAWATLIDAQRALVQQALGVKA